jgi:hypothetical protein
LVGLHKTRCLCGVGLTFPGAAWDQKLNVVACMYACAGHAPRRKHGAVEVQVDTIKGTSCTDVPRESVLYRAQDRLKRFGFDRASRNGSVPTSVPGTADSRPQPLLNTLVSVCVCGLTSYPAHVGSVSLPPRLKRLDGVANMCQANAAGWMPRECSCGRCAGTRLERS